MVDDSPTGSDPMVEDEEIILAIRNHPHPSLSTNEVSDGIEIGQQRTYERPTDLAESELVQTKILGNSRAWWLTDRGEKFLDGDLEPSDLQEDE